MFILLIIIFFTSQLSFAQETFEEYLLEEQAENSDQSELVELLNKLRSNPINLNQATREQLSELPGINSELIENILSYRRVKGKFEFKEELFKVPGMDDECFDRIFDFVTVTAIEGKNHPVFSNIHFRSRVLDKNDSLKSVPQKFYNRLRFRAFDLVNGGVLFEKDRGEKSFDDLRLFYLEAELRVNWYVIAGNFQFLAGQGLVFWGPYGFAKGAAATFSVRKKGKGLRHYMSVDENASLFGAGISFKNRRFNFSLFVSKNALDASLAANDEVTSLQKSGLHISEAELARKDAIQEQLLASRVAWNTLPNLNIGATAYWAAFSKTINNPEIESKHFDFRGKENSVVGFDWTYVAGGTEFFGEIARSHSGGRAIIAGVRLKMHPIQLAFLYRNYARDFNNRHSFGFGERNGDSQNEIGYYTGLEYKISKNTRLNAYYDIYSFPWRSYSEPLPLSGSDFLLQVEHRLNRTFQVTIRFADKTTPFHQELPTVSPQLYKPVMQKHRRRLRLQLDMRVTKKVKLRSRMEYTGIRLAGFPDVPENGTENGFLLYQDLRLLLVPQLLITTRLSLFDTDSFESRVFQFEHDLPGVLTNRALFGLGSRWYFILKYKPGKFGVFHLKYSAQFRDESRGSKSEKRLSAQLDLRL